MFLFASLMSYFRRVCVYFSSPVIVKVADVEKMESVDPTTPVVDHSFPMDDVVVPAYDVVVAT
jgi:hypothetical protein